MITCEAPCARRSPSSNTAIFSARSAGGHTGPSRNSKRAFREICDYLRFVYRHFPLSEIHPLALPAAEAAEAAGAQGKFWEMHGILFRNQPNFEPEDLMHYAADLDLGIDEFILDLVTHRHLPKIRGDFMGGVRSGVNGTPCLFINGERFNGPVDGPLLARAIDAARRSRYAEAR